MAVVGPAARGPRWQRAFAQPGHRLRQRQRRKPPTQHTELPVELFRADLVRNQRVGLGSNSVVDQYRKTARKRTHRVQPCPCGISIILPDVVVGSMPYRRSIRRSPATWTLPSLRSGLRRLEVGYDFRRERPMTGRTEMKVMMQV